MPPSSNQSRSYLIIILVLLLLLAVGAALYFFYQNRQLSSNAASSTSQSEANEVIAAVGKLLILPANETPTVATVSDPSALRSQPFFANAEVGDKVLIYSNNKEAILYRPSINKIIAVSPITFQDQNNLGATSTATVTPPTTNKK